MIFYTCPLYSDAEATPAPGVHSNVYFENVIFLTFSHGYLEVDIADPTGAPPDLSLGRNLSRSVFEAPCML